MDRRVWLVAGGLVLVLVVIGVGLAVNIPAVSEVEVKRCLTSVEGADCIRFPIVSGSNLLDEELTLPDDFAGDYVLVIVPFDEGQQVRAASWLEPARDLTAQYPGLTYYNTAIFTDIAPAVRLFIRGGMFIAITEEALRRVTITLFLEDREAFLQALAVPDIEDTEVFLLNAAGEVVWRGRGDYDITQGAALAAQLAALAGSE